VFRSSSSSHKMTTTAASLESGMLRPPLEPDKEEIERFGKDFNRYIAKDLVNQTYNERLAQHAGTGVATALSSRRKAIDAAFTNMFHDGKKHQLAMDGGDELNLWLLDRTALIGNPKLANAQRFIPSAGPYLFTDLEKHQIAELEAVSWNDPEAQAQSSDDSYETWFRQMQMLDLSQGSSTQEQLAAISSDQPMGLQPQGARVPPSSLAPQGIMANQPRPDPRTLVRTPETNVIMTSERKERERKIQTGDSNRQTGAIGPQPQLQPQQREFKAPVLPEDDIKGMMRGNDPARMNTTGDGTLPSQQFNNSGHYGGLADYFMPNDSQKKRNAEAKTLKALAATSHPSVIFARKYFQEYDQTDPIERQALPMQRELTQRRVTTLDTIVSQKTNPRDYELVKVLLDRDALEADLALDPADDELIAAMDRVLERWDQIKLV